jgi:prepilin-type N-terminal cleavage/methylation domain-containing protein
MVFCHYALMIRLRSGFTLIELSIVLVIIGLIAGGILISKDLIEAARIRQQISQLQQYSTAVNTFRLKYSGIPGDLAGNKAQQFGFTSRSGAQAHGDGNGTLGACSLSGVYTSDRYFGCETALFWSDLSTAHMIGNNLTAATDDFVVLMNANNIDQYLPRSKLNGYVAVFSYALMEDFLSLPDTPKCKNTFCYALIKSMDTLLDGKLSAQIGITSGQAFAMDTKMDDGKPSTGIVLTGPSSLNNGYSFYIYHAPDIANDRCRTLATNSYNLTPDQIDLPECIVNIVYK